MPAQPTTRLAALMPDIIAGITVALVAVPQSMAYAELAGIPAQFGLYAVALPPLFAAFFASSAWLQTGPVATTSLLTVGALAAVSTIGAPDYVALASLLAILVGLFRAGIGLLRGGAISYLMNHAVLRGFILAAALLIFSSQLPSVLGMSATHATVMGRALEVLRQPGSWEPSALGFTLLTLAFIFGGRRIHPMFPGVLVATAVALVVSILMEYRGPTLEHVPSGLPPISLDLPWDRVSDLLLPAAIIALVGFAEAASIGQTFAEMERVHWDPNRAFVGQGIANIAAGISGGFPVGGSFSRSALNHLAGARTRLSGGVTGAAVLCMLPFASVLEPLPKAVLGAIVIAAVRSLLRLEPMLEIWRLSRRQFAVGASTFVLTLALAPRVELAVFAGTAISIAVHLWGELSLDVSLNMEGDTLTLQPRGTLWFGSAPALRRQVTEQLADHPGLTHLRIDMSGLGSIDMSGAMMVGSFVETVQSQGIQVRVLGAPSLVASMLRTACPADVLEGNSEARVVP